MDYIIENTSDSIWAIDGNYQILYLNKSFRDDFKSVFDVDLQIGDNILGKLPSEISVFWKTKYDLALDGKTFSFENSLPDKNNQTIYVHVSFSPIYENDTIIGVTCFGRDITKEKLNELALRRYSLLLKASLESQKDTFLLSIDRDFKYMYFNKAHFDGMKYSYNVEVALGMNIIDCITDEGDKLAARENYLRAFNGESHSNIRIFGDKNKEYYESYFNPIYDQNNEIIGATAMARNISNRIKQEEALKKSELFLKEANITKNKFFSLIAHDLRSPVASISSMIDFLLEKFDDFEQKKQKFILQNISSTIHVTYVLLEDLLLWARTQNNSIKFHPESFCITDLISDIIGVFNHNISQKKLNVLFNRDNSLSVFADKQMIATIVRNLLYNAIKYSFSEGDIEIELKSKTNHIKKIIFTVRDYGVGMNPDKQAKMFILGEDVSTPGTNNEKGSGLGLIMCKEFAERHGGKIIVESEEGKGTIVTLEIPQ